MKHPMQKIYRDDSGVVRFRGNEIIRHLCDTGALDLNRVAIMGFSDEDHMQVAQLLGYSVGGFGELSYADEKTVRLADLAAARLTTGDIPRSQRTESEGDDICNCGNRRRSQCDGAFATCEHPV